MLHQLSLTMLADDLVSALEESHALLDVEHHPLGFYRVALTNSDRLQEGYYLHVWPERPLSHQDTESEIHQHIFELESRIICGSLINHEYEVRDDDAGSHQLMVVKYMPTESARLPIGRRVSWTESSRNEYIPGDVYSLRRGTFHSTTVTNRPTATLLLKRAIQTTRDPLNVGPLSLPRAHESTFDHRPQSQAEAWEEIFRVLRVAASLAEQDR